MFSMLLRSEKFSCLTASCFVDSPYGYTSDQKYELASIIRNAASQYLNGQLSLPVTIADGTCLSSTASRWRRRLCLTGTYAELGR